MSKDQNANLFAEIKRLRELVEKQHSELNWLRGLNENRNAGDNGDIIVLPTMSTDPKDHGRLPVYPVRPAPLVDDQSWPTRPVPASPLHPNPGLLSYTFALSVTKVLGVAVLGLKGEDLERVVSQVQESQRRTQDFIPVFLIDSSETGIFRKRGFVYEYLPAFGHASKDRLPVLREIAEQHLNLLRDKWNMAGIIAIGSSPLYPVGEPVNISEDSASAVAA